MPLDPFYADAIQGFEGFAPSASWDYKQHSNGYGTRAQYPGETIDRDTAEQRFQAELTKAAAQVDAIAPNAPPGARAALVSLTYNAGPGWTGARLGELVRAGDWDAAAQRLQQYNKAGGQTLPGLEKRRAAEAGWFNAPMAGVGQPPQMAQQAPPVAASFPAIAYGGSPNNAPAGLSVAPQSQPQALPQEQPPEMAMQAMQILGGAPRRPPDFKRLMAKFNQARPTSRV